MRYCLRPAGDYDYDWGLYDDVSLKHNARQEMPKSSIHNLLPADARGSGPSVRVDGQPARYLPEGTNFPRKTTPPTPTLPLAS